MQDVMLPVRAVPKNDYITSPTAPSGTDRQFMQAKAPRVQLYRLRVAAGRDLWTGNELSSGEGRPGSD
ncbi:MAG: hypothetical protein QF363_16970 [Planctomycetaceae bacterium]|jgi:hypothetical protein|nr:hypothetical protein [Planctomycetaceae bacterium]